MTARAATTPSALREHAQAVIRNAFPGTAAAVVILGSGLDGWMAAFSHDTVALASDIPGFPPSAPPGRAMRISSACIEGRRILILSGRPHEYDGYTPEQCALAVHAAEAAEARVVITTNAAGGVDPSFVPGDLMLIDDILVSPLARRMGGTVHAYPRPYRMQPAYRACALAAAADAGIALRAGTYGLCSGPSYETRAEIAFLRAAGAGAIGMSTVPEFLACTEADIPIIGISCITNRAVTVRRPTSHNEVLRVAASASARVGALIRHILRRLPE